MMKRKKAKFGILICITVILTGMISVSGCSNSTAKKPPPIETVPLSQEQAEATIVADYGWGQVHIGATKQELDAILGEGNSPQKFGTVYFVDYPSIGLQISFSSSDNKVHAMFFYNKQKGSEQFATFFGKTSVGIDWNSSVEQVIEAYGQPHDDIQSTRSGISMRRLVFDGIDFRYENDKMVRIGVPGK
jgi:hypothetical protein